MPRMTSCGNHWRELPTPSSFGGKPTQKIAVAGDVRHRIDELIEMTRSGNLSLSEQDHFNSNGQRLTAAAAIVDRTVLTFIGLV